MVRVHDPDAAFDDDVKVVAGIVFAEDDVALPEVPHHQVRRKERQRGWEQRREERQVHGHELRRQSSLDKVADRVPRLREVREPFAHRRGVKVQEEALRARRDFGGRVHRRLAFAVVHQERRLAEEIARLEGPDVILLVVSCGRRRGGGLARHSEFAREYDV